MNPVIRPDFIDVKVELLKLVELFMVALYRFAPVRSQLLNTVDDKLLPDKSSDTMFSEEYVPPCPIITNVMMLLTVTAL